MPMSAFFALRIVPPESRASMSASRVAAFLIPSAAARSSFPRSRPFIRGHGPSSNAVLAASAARRTSSSPALATRANGSPVEGSIDSKVSPDAASASSPPITRR
jgi:hypothetical protein